VLGSLVVILREVLEAAMVVSLLLALYPRPAYSIQWLFYGALMSIILAVLIGLQIDHISNGFEGMGLEILNATALLLNTILLLFLISQSPNEHGDHSNLNRAAALVVALSFSMELSEILIYWYEQLFIVGTDPRHLASGSIIGIGIGLSSGALIFLLLTTSKKRILLSKLLLSLVAAGFASQSISWLQQANWLSDTGPVISTEFILPEQSIPGQLLSALIGYESTPSSYQFAAYMLVIAWSLYGLGKSHLKKLNIRYLFLR